MEKYFINDNSRLQNFIIALCLFSYQIVSAFQSMKNLVFYIIAL